MPELAIYSRRVVLPDGVRAATILINNGKIQAILDGLAEVGCELINVGDSVLMAGVVDPHVHINEPGRTSWEGFETATKAAIAGGITTLVEMPLNASPVTTTVAAFEQKLAAAAGKLHTDIGFWGGIIPGNENEIEPLIEKGVLGFKAFLTHSGIDEFPNATEADLRKAMPVIAKHGLPLLVHCELMPPTPEGEKKDSAKNARSYWQYMESRPKEWEDNAIALMIQLCEQFNCRTHIVHLSSANSIAQIKAAKKQGLPLTVETAQHYLYFSAEEIEDGNTAFKCAPPIREKANNDLLWEALKDGTIDFVATDHSPAPPEIKQIDKGDFMTGWGGIASLQFALPVLWTAANSRGSGLENIAKWLCSNPAKLVGLQNSKGKIAAGFDADLVVWNPEQSFIVKEEIIQHRHKITPYLNQELLGNVVQTYLAGEKVFDNGVFVSLHKGGIVKGQ